MQRNCADTEVYKRHDSDDLGFSTHPLSYAKDGSYVGQADGIPPKI